jgi:hypothetical protein
MVSNNKKILRVAIDIPMKLPEIKVEPMQIFSCVINDKKETKEGSGIITLFYCPERNICDSFSPSDIDCEACVVGAVCPAGVVYDSDDYWLEINDGD